MFPLLRASGVIDALGHALTCTSLSCNIVGNCRIGKHFLSRLHRPQDMHGDLESAPDGVVCAGRSTTKCLWSLTRGCCGTCITSLCPDKLGLVRAMSEAPAIAVPRQCGCSNLTCSYLTRLGMVPAARKQFRGLFHFCRPSTPKLSFTQVLARIRKKGGSTAQESWFENGSVMYAEFRQSKYVDREVQILPYPQPFRKT